MKIYEKEVRITELTESVRKIKVVHIFLGVRLGFTNYQHETLPKQKFDYTIGNLFISERENGKFAMETLEKRI